MEAFQKLKLLKRGRDIILYLWYKLDFEIKKKCPPGSLPIWQAVKSEISMNISSWKSTFCVDKQKPVWEIDPKSYST